MNSVPLHTLADFLRNELQIDMWQGDPSNNGLQYEGRQNVSVLACAVDACDAVFDMANAAHADALFVHHGFSWGPGIPRVNGIIGRRITKLATTGLSLYAAHLPLDVHRVLGHNALLADMISLTDRKPFGTWHDRKIGIAGTLPQAVTASELTAVYEHALPSRGAFRTMSGDMSRKYRKVAVISGGGAWPDLFEECIAEGVECLITGDAPHECYHPAREAGTEVISLGHYRSEIPGVIAVGKLVAEKFGIDCPFLDYPTEL